MGISEKERTLMLSSSLLLTLLPHPRLLLSSYLLESTTRHPERGRRIHLHADDTTFLAIHLLASQRTALGGCGKGLGTFEFTSRWIVYLGSDDIHLIVLSNGLGHPFNPWRK